MASAGTLFSGTQTTSSSFVVAAPQFSRIRAAVFQLNVTAAATAAGDTLDVYVQTAVDDTNWDDIVHFTQVLGNGGAKTFLAYLNATLVPATPIHAPQNKALAVGVNQGPVGDGLRVAWTIASSSSPSFTFSVKGAFIYR